MVDKRPVLWVASLFLQGILTFLLLKKKMWNSLPFFTSYSISSFMCGVGLYVVYTSAFLRRPQLYLKLYWACEALGIFLGLAVVFEIFKHLLAPYLGLRKLARQLFWIALTLLILLGCIVAYVEPISDPNRISAALLSIEQAARILEVGLLAVLFLFARLFGLHWHQTVFGIALGMGVYVTAEVLAVTMRIQFGLAATPAFNFIRSIAFISSLWIWGTYLLAPEIVNLAATHQKTATSEVESGCSGTYL